MSQKSNNNQIDTPKAVYSAVEQVLRALVRILLHFQITYPQVSEMLKKAFIEVAESEHSLPNKKQTDSRISVLTGVHRKDTKRIREELRSGAITSESISTGVQVIAKWVSDPTYLAKDGNALPLPLRGEEPSFDTLVQSVVKGDFGSRALLDEWLASGVVMKENDTILLNQDAFIPKENLEEKAFFFGMNISDHLSAINQNLSDTENSFFERCVYYDGLSKTAVEELEAFSRKENMAALKNINKHAIKLKASKTGQGPFRFNNGIYHFNDLTTEAGEDDE